MTYKEIFKDFFSKVIFPVAVTLLLYSMFKSLCIKNGVMDWFLLWILCGIPFGIRKMFVLLVPHGFDLGATVGILALSFILGGLIGGVILIWRLLRAVWYLILTIYRLFIINKKNSVTIVVEELQ